MRGEYQLARRYIRYAAQNA